jgi:ATP-dependent Lhr-like helicase
LGIYRRLEMRGEIRGGRFIAGVAGEQFGLSQSVDRLRQVRDLPAQQDWQVVSAADPLNLIGIVTSQARVPATRGNRIAFLDGRPIASREGGQIRWLADADDAIRNEATKLLAGPDSLRRAAGPLIAEGWPSKRSNPLRTPTSISESTEAI